MKIFGFNINIHSDIEEMDMRDTIVAVIANPRISIKTGKELIGMFITGRITEQQLHKYSSAQAGNDDVTDEMLFANLDKWQEEQGAFSSDDMLYLHSCKRTKGYRAKPTDIAGIVDYINSRVIGQKQAVNNIVSAVWLHVNSVRQGLGIKVPAQLLIGQTGVGKTQILNLLSEVLNVPVINIFASTITAPGYRGGDSLTDQIFSQYANISCNTSTQQLPIMVMIHEIDKTARGVNDGYRVELMSSIMSIIERGSIVKANVVGGNNILNLENVLVLFDGCFDGIEKIAGRRVGMNAMGFNHSQSCIETDLRSMITKADLVKYGMMTEFVGRIANPICLNSMSLKLMHDILTHSVNSPTASYIRAFKQYGIDLKFSSEATKAMAQIAFENQTFGARSLETIVSAVMGPYTHLLTSKTKQTVRIGKKDVYRVIGQTNLNFK